jgi:hypothetical protein
MQAENLPHTHAQRKIPWSDNMDVEAKKQEKERPRTH